MMAEQQSQQRQQQQQQQPTSYPSPSAHSYPSPSMQPTYTYPPQGQAPHDQYRGSPQVSNMSLPPLNLPPIRLQDGQTQPSQQQQGQQQMGSPLPPQQHGMPPQYYSHPSHQAQGQSMGMGANQHLAMRYQLPPQQGEQRILSGGRHKKEIKRRTKTGCLTCRKRRIKCDEAHPVCRNCQKSKRECLGYDPIFKQQPGPAQIQPAPDSTPHQAPVPAPAPPNSSTPYGGQVPQGYAPAGYPPPPPPSGGHSGHENYSSNNAIDPALAGTDPALHGGHQAYNGAHAMNPALRAGMDSASPYSATSEPPLLKAKRLQISDLFPIGGHPPPEISPRTTPIPAELDESFKTLFANDYCHGLDTMLETKWFSTNNNAMKRIMANNRLREEAVHFVETARTRIHSADMAGVFSEEARLIWHILAVCKQPSPATNGTNGAHGEEEDLSLREARARFDILEALLTNQTLGTNPMSQISYPRNLDSYKRAEVDFWLELGNFVIYADSEPSNPQAIEYALGAIRNVLHAQEVRDAIYSIAIARHFGNRVRGFPSSLPAVVDQNPESDINKLHVAMGFISYECRQGSQQVTARICDMAMLSWTVGRTP